MNGPWSRSKESGIRKDYLKESFVYEITDYPSDDEREDKGFPDVLLPKKKKEKHDHEKSNHERNIAHREKKSIQHIPIEILEGSIDWIFERVEGSKE